MSKNLIARIAVAAVFIPAILWVCYQGGVWLLGMLTLFALIGIAEFMIGEKIQRFSPSSGAPLLRCRRWFAQSSKSSAVGLRRILFSIDCFSVFRGSAISLLTLATGQNLPTN